MVRLGIFVTAVFRLAALRFAATARGSWRRTAATLAAAASTINLLKFIDIKIAHVLTPSQIVLYG